METKGRDIDKQARMLRGLQGFSKDIFYYQQNLQTKYAVQNGKALEDVNSVIKDLDAFDKILCGLEKEIFACHNKLAEDYKFLYALKTGKYEGKYIIKSAIDFPKEQAKLEARIAKNEAVMQNLLEFNNASENSPLKEMSKIYTKIDTLEFGKITKAQGAMIRVVASRELYTSAIKHLDIKFVASRGVDSCGDYYKVVRASDSKVLLQSSANILKNED